MQNDFVIRQQTRAVVNVLRACVHCNAPGADSTIKDGARFCDHCGEEQPTVYDNTGHRSVFRNVYWLRLPKFLGAPLHFLKQTLRAWHERRGASNADAVHSS